MLIFLLLLASALGIQTDSQVSIDRESYSDPICDTRSECRRCSFKELRELEACSMSGYIQNVYCTMQHVPTNSTQEITYISSCDFGLPSILESFNIFFIVVSAISIWSVAQVMNSKKVHARMHQEKLRNIIKT